MHLTCIITMCKRYWPAGLSGTACLSSISCLHASSPAPANAYDKRAAWTISMLCTADLAAEHTPARQLVSRQHAL
jgi:hypothetical protein